MRFVVIVLVYFFIGIALCSKMKPEDDFIDIIKNYFGLILMFTFLCYLINSTQSLVMRYFQQELVKYLNAKIDTQQEFENILKNLEECIITIEEDQGITFCNAQGLDILTNAHLLAENQHIIERENSSNNYEELSSKFS